MIPTTLTALTDFLNKNKYSADIQKETQQVFTILKIAQREYPLFLRIFEESQHLQMLVFIPTQLKPEVRNDVARLLHILNKEMDLPGFGMDENAGVVFYRLMIPTLNKKIDSDLLLGYLKTANKLCELFMEPIEAVCQGQTSLDEILRKAQESEKTK